MKHDYFSDLLPAGVTRVTQPEKQCVTPEPDSMAHENNDLGEASRASRTNNSDTRKKTAGRTLRVYRYRLTDYPDSEMVLIAPGTDLQEATDGLRARFGKRLIDVVPHLPDTNSKK